MRVVRIEHSAGRVSRLAAPRASRLGAIVFALGVASAAQAQVDSSSRIEQAGSTTLRVGRATGVLRLNGSLSEPVWSRADSITDFRQREPLEGALASERTVVKVARDADALYVMVHAYDREPRAIRARQLRRDADLGSDDNITLLKIGRASCRERG